jgi:TRAP-type transport system periplasmic protein
MGFVFSKKFMDTLSPEEQKIIKDAAQDASTYQRELNREKSNEFLQTLVDNGMVVTELSKEAAKEFEESVQSVHKEFEEKIGKDYYDEYMAQVK